MPHEPGTFCGEAFQTFLRMMLPFSDHAGFFSEGFPSSYVLNVLAQHSSSIVGGLSSVRSVWVEVIVSEEDTTKTRTNTTKECRHVSKRRRISIHQGVSYSVSFPLVELKSSPSTKYSKKLEDVKGYTLSLADVLLGNLPLKKTSKHQKKFFYTPDEIFSYSLSKSTTITTVLPNEDIFERG